MAEPLLPISDLRRPIAFFVAAASQTAAVFVLFVQMDSP